MYVNTLDAVRVVYFLPAFLSALRAELMLLSLKRFPLALVKTPTRALSRKERERIQCVIYILVAHPLLEQTLVETRRRALFPQ